MIELRGLHLGNIARSPDESVRPDLWPDHAWVPALGCTGGVLYDLCGGRSAVVNFSAHEWVAGSGLRIHTASGAAIVTIGSVAISGGYTLVAGGIFTWSYWGGICSLMGVVASGNWTYGRDKLSLHYGQYFKDDAIRCVSTTKKFGDTSTWTWGGCLQASPAASIITANGVIIAGTPQVYGTTAYNSITLRLFGGLFDNVTGPASVGSVLSAFLFYRAPRPEILPILTADPLLPFRRRQPVFYSVPSGGGASLAASSAWRVFTAAAIDTAWAIRAALAGSTSWAVLTGSGTATGWRIAAVSDAETAWNLRAAAAYPSAWRILAASEADTAWRIAADLNASTAWAILTSMDAATAWAIIAAGTLLANTAWAILTDADTDTDWRIKDDAAADTAWAVRNARDAATAWDIQAALAGATAWRITTDLQADTAWTVIADMDADAAWNILRADPTGTAWRVCTDLDTPTSWAVFSDIIPEPVRLFLAPGRQFIINAASRVLIITKTRP